jgi:predicted secreted Zn-dependent protease
MHIRSRLACLLFVIVSAAACQPPVAASAPPGSAAPATVVATPRPTPDPCIAAVTGVGPYLQRLATDLAALRPLVLAGTFDPPATKTGVRAVSATLTSLLKTDRSLATCRLATKIAAQLRALRAKAKDPLAAALAASTADGPAMRAGAVQLLALLPDVLAVSKTTAGVAASLGLDVALAEVPADATKPIGSLPPFPSAAPAPTLKPPAKGKVVVVTASYFGAAATVKTYRVTGGSRDAIIRSINTKGPYSGWSGGHAEAITAAQPTYRFSFVTATLSACTIVPSASPAIKITYTITLPAWKPPAGTTAATITWWNGELTSFAKHERHHVDIYRDGQAKLIAALATSTCANAQAHLDAVWRAINRQQCEFDMAEYGTQLGLSLQRCLDG